MKKKIISLSLLCILGVSMAGCMNNRESTQSEQIKENDNNFIKVKDLGYVDDIYMCEYIDRETGVHYYIGKSNSYRGCMSPVYDSNGKVRVDK